MTPRELDLYLADYLEVSNYSDHSPNKMIVEGERPLQRGVTGVSLNLQLIQAAVDADADFIIVHHPHGFWNEDPKLPRGVMAEKLRLLIKNGISVYGYHLPLDGHLVLGNNALLADAIGLKKRSGFIPSGSAFVGCHGSLPEPVGIEEMLTLISQQIAPPLYHFSGGGEKVQKIAICSGGAPSAVEELLEEPGIDLYLTGEVRETTQQLALEERFHFVACGHHATERFGVRALGERLQSEYALKINFIDIDNPV